MGRSGKASREALVTKTKPKKIGFLASQWTIKLGKHIWISLMKCQKKTRIELQSDTKEK